MKQGFLQKLEEELSKTKPVKRFNVFSIAASVIVLLGLSYGAFKYYNSPVEPIINNPTVVDTNKANKKTLGDVSPDLKKVEDYYLASINLELSKVELTPENKELFDGYIQRLKELNTEYDALTEELNTKGPNEDTLDALINNLKFRLNLVMRLKQKLKEYSEDSYQNDLVI